MSKKKKKNKKIPLNKIQKKVKKFGRQASANTILLGIAGGAIISGMVFAGLRSQFLKSKYEIVKD